MRSYFDKQLELLNNEMLNMSDMCEDAISQAINALLNGDRMKAAGLKKSVDQINQQERYIENICVKLLANRPSSYWGTTDIRCFTSFKISRILAP